jgi:hypothetical protein
MNKDTHALSSKCKNITGLFPPASPFPRRSFAPRILLAKCHQIRRNGRSLPHKTPCPTPPTHTPNPAGFVCDEIVTFFWLHRLTHEVKNSQHQLTVHAVGRCVFHGIGSLPGQVMPEGKSWEQSQLFQPPRSIFPVSGMSPPAGITKIPAHMPGKNQTEK